jgi:Tol biopolymer transport system component
MPRTSRNLTAFAAVLASAATAVLAVIPAFAASTSSSAPAPKRVIAFEKETSTSPADVWVANATGGAQRKLGGGELPAVSPNGAMVVAARDNGSAVLLYSTSGAPTHTFLTHTGAPVAFAWSPDSRYIAVSLDSTSVNGVTGAGLAVIDTDTDTDTVIVKAEISGASFAVNGTDRIVYGAAPSLNVNAPSNLYTTAPDGSAKAQLTHDNRSLNPLWGAKGIAFDRERLRHNDFPVYQVWLLSGTHLRQLTNMAVPSLLSGLVPLAFSADGNRMIAEYGGQDTNYAWTIQISPLRVRQVPGFVQGGGISRSGNSLLIDRGAFMQAANSGTVEAIPFAAAAPVRKLVRGADPSWNL